MARKIRNQDHSSTEFYGLGVKFKEVEMKLVNDVTEHYGKVLDQVIKAIVKKEDFQKVCVMNEMGLYLPLFQALNELYRTGLFLPEELYALLSKRAATSELRDLHSKIAKASYTLSVSESRITLH